MHASLPSDAKTVDRMRAAIGIELNSNTAQKAIAFLKAHQVVVDPTLALDELQTASSAKPTASFEPGVDKIARELAAQLIEVGPPDPETETREKFFAKALEVVGALHRAGLTSVAGTDQAVPGHSLHREIELYYQAGFTPIEAIQAATIVPARAGDGDHKGKTSSSMTQSRGGLRRLHLDSGRRSVSKSVAACVQPARRAHKRNDGARRASPLLM